jgi:hypothetical protein
LNFHTRETGGKTTALCVTMFHMPKRPRDPNQLAKLIVDIATGEADDTVSESKRQPAKRGRAGGLKGGKARAKSLSASRRSAIAGKAAKSRWNRPNS